MTSSPSFPLPANPQQQRLCQGRYGYELALCLPLDGLPSSSSTPARSLAAKLIGSAPLLFHPFSPSAVSALAAADPKISTRGFQHVGKVFQETGN